MNQKQCTIIEHRKLCKEYFYMKLGWEQADKVFHPGQFVEIKVSHTTDPLLRRPFSIFDADKNSFSIAYRVIGKGTTLLSQKVTGDMIDVIGPLGNTYPLENMAAAEKVVLIGGGTGSASLFFLAKKLSQKNISFETYLGFKSTHDIFCIDAWEEFKTPLVVATEDGSYGEKGFITDFLSCDSINTLVYACGLLPMLKVVRDCVPNAVMYASFEEYMACGTGLCSGCVIKLALDATDPRIRCSSANSDANKPHSHEAFESLDNKIKKDTAWEYKKVCKDGPVFNAKDVLWQ